MGLPEARESGLFGTGGAISQIIESYPEFNGEIPGILMYRLPGLVGKLAVDRVRGRLADIFFPVQLEGQAIQLRNTKDGPFLAVFNPYNFKPSIEFDGKNYPLTRVVIDGKVIDLSSPDDSPKDR